MDSILDLVSQLAQKYDLPQWLVIGGPIVIVAMVVFLIFLIFKIIEPSYRLYKEDVFYGVIWRWHWRGSEVVDLWCFCPTCKAMLYVDDENCRATSSLNEKITFFVCHDCGEHEKGRLKGGDRRYVLNVVKRDIAAKIRHKSFDIYERR